MYARFAGAAAREGSASDAAQALPEGIEEATPATRVPQSAGLSQHQQDQELKQDATRILQPSSPSPTVTTLPGTSAKPPPGRSVETMARKLSKHNLELGATSQLQTQPAPLPVEPPEWSTSQHWAEYEPYSLSQHYLHDPPPEQHTTPWLPILAQDEGEPIEVDEAYVERPDDKRLLNMRQPPRQTSGWLRGSPASSRLANSRVLEEMITNGTQCNVRSWPRSTPRPSYPAPGPVITADPSFIEPDPDCTMPDPALEIDGTDAGAISELSSQLLIDAAGGMPLRNARGPGGIRKYTVGGVPLRYQLSADAALRCANVVRSKPRMRKRNKTRHGSAESFSAVASPITSPAASPSARSPPLPPLHLPP